MCLLICAHCSLLCASCLLIGFKWQFALPELPAEEASDNEGEDQEREREQQEREDEARGDDEEEGVQKTTGVGVGVGVGPTVAIGVVMEPRTKLEEDAMTLDGSHDRGIPTMSARRSQKPQRKMNETVIVPLTKSVGSHEQLVEVEVQTVRRLRACPELAGDTCTYTHIHMHTHIHTHTHTHAYTYIHTRTSMEGGAPSYYSLVTHPRIHHVTPPSHQPHHKHARHQERLTPRGRLVASIGRNHG